MASIFAIARFSTPGSTGNVDITTTDLGGVMPVACMIIGNNAESDGVAIAGHVFGAGLCDATNEGSVTGGSANGVGTSNGQRATHNTQVINFGTLTSSREVDDNSV